MADVRTATREDVSAVSVVLALAFADEPAMRHMHPLGDFQQMRAHIEMWLDAYWDVSEVWLVDGQRGAAWWITPAAARLSEDPGDAILQAEADLLGEHRAVYFDTTAEMTRRHPSGQPHWYLVMIGTRPSDQGTGVGSLLISPVLAHCDREGLPIYAERADPRNQSFYERHGFRTIGEFDLPHAGPRVSQIWRDPLPSQA